MENKNSGTYNLIIGIYEIRSLPIAFEVQKYNIEVGDSETKEANSKIMKFYKKRMVNLKNIVSMK